MRRSGFLLCLFLAASLPLPSQEGGAGGSSSSFLTASALTGRILFDPARIGRFGGGAELSLWRESFPLAPRLGVGLWGDYRWMRGEEEGAILSLPGLGASVSWRFTLGGLLALRPLLSAGLEAEAAQGRTELSFLGTGALEAAFRLGRRDYLTLGLAADWAPARSFPLGLSLSLGSRSETLWGGEGGEGGEPGLSIVSMTRIFSPDGDGRDDLFRLELALADRKACVSYRLRVLLPDGTPFKEWSGPGAPPGRLAWDGRSASGELVDPGTDYLFEAEARGASGRTERLTRPLSVDILVLREGADYKVMLPDIHFPPDSSSLDGSASAWMLAENRAVLDRLEALLRRFPSYSIIVEGHANSTEWMDAAAFKRENEEVLIPLSKRRAEAVASALVSLGIERRRISSRGMGGERPLVPFAAKADSWKNRRVEILLKR